jgi:cell division initiation protein
VGQLRSELGELRTREQTLQKTLVTAQRMTEEMKDKARSESELVVREAQFRADQILKDARNQLAQVEADISRSKTERETLERQLRGVAEQFLAMLDMREQARGEPDNVHRMPDRASTEVG